MARAALTKLLVLVILTFIICLPEFFSLYRESKVNFLCLPYRPCKRGNQGKKGENGKIGDSDIERTDMCDPYQTGEWEKWEQACTEGNHSHMTDPASDSRRSSNDSEKSWFMCQTDTDMAKFHHNISFSGRALNVHLEVSVELQLDDADTLNLTLYGHSNYSFLDLHPPEEQGEEEGEKGGEGQKAFYCCLPVLPASESANPSRCLLWFANQTVSIATAKEKLPWKRTQKEKPMVSPVNSITGQQLHDGEKHTEIITPRGAVLHFYRSRPWSELSPIQECKSQEDIETLLDGSADHCHAANLHHRGHPSTSSITEEEQEEKSTEMDI
ncbi:uncharacterized protein LOC121180286 isoform X4 [Toxotes jaculatrix]|uniref:uncharacterized protein LOC121180286 isoform X4 n=1 Tax=Toxotes jaculatrix TaxID=941984 RepID=UPI001B3B06E9|nr:uncharacterized protein LOC121180286 isoform X4 [Toxotes jaculatrix]